MTNVTDGTTHIATQVMFSSCPILGPFFHIFSEFSLKKSPDIEIYGVSQ